MQTSAKQGSICIDSCNGTGQKDTGVVDKKTDDRIDTRP